VKGSFIKKVVGDPVPELLKLIDRHLEEKIRSGELR
jgi:hypothetical protein